MMKKIFLLSLMFFASIFFFTGCDKEDANLLPPDYPYSKEEVLKIMDHLEKYYGFKKSSLKVQGEDIVAEEDMIFPIKEFWEKYGMTGTGYTNNSNSSLEKKHYRTLLVSVSNPPKMITLNVLGSTPSNWRSVIKVAANHWNDLNGDIQFSVKFSERYVSGAVNISGAVLESHVPADAKSPSSDGKPGERIRINTYGPSLTSGQKIFTMVHEIGHTIGFKHTDVSSEGILISNVSSKCKTKSDPKSVMREYVQEWNGFSPCDVEAFYALY